ncbi:MAG: hypothetical protein HYZ28_02565 [Myxococcales bacterium]|nr:hypothetical protein [Myxococcales bacterium]
MSTQAPRKLEAMIAHLVCSLTEVPRKTSPSRPEITARLIRWVWLV